MLVVVFVCYIQAEGSSSVDDSEEDVRNPVPGPNLVTTFLQGIPFLGETLSFGARGLKSILEGLLDFLTYVI